MDCRGRRVSRRRHDRPEPGAESRAFIEHLGTTSHHEASPHLNPYGWRVTSWAEYPLIGNRNCLNLCSRMSQLHRGVLSGVALTRGRNSGAASAERLRPSVNSPLDEPVERGP